MRPDFPFRPAAVPVYYGRVVLAFLPLGVFLAAPFMRDPQASSPTLGPS